MDSELKRVARASSAAQFSMAVAVAAAFAIFILLAL